MTTQGSTIASLTALGGGDEVGGSCYLYDFGSTRILVDAGGRNNKTGEAALPLLNRLQAGFPEHVLITHAHYDHVGALPMLMKMLPRAILHCTEPTAHLAKLVLEDSFKLQREAGERLQAKEDLDRALAALRPDIIAGRPMRAGAVEIIPHSAGHLLGAVGFTFRCRGGVVVHLGDHNHQSTPTTRGMRDPGAGSPRRTGELETTDADVVITESTYGGRDLPSREAMVIRLAHQVEETLSRGGHVLIPSFALGRAQDVVHSIERMMARGVIRPADIRLDGMVREATRIHERMQRWLPEETRRSAFGNWTDDATRGTGRQQSMATKGMDAGSKFEAGKIGHERKGLEGREWQEPERKKGGKRQTTRRLGAICGPHTLMVDRREREDFLAEPRPGVTIASSGMLTGGASVAYASRLLRGHNNLLLLVGYQEAESPGASLLNAKAGSKIWIGSGRTREQIKVEAKIGQLSLSAHADQGAVASYCRSVTREVREQGKVPEAILLHGEEEAREALESLIRQDMPVRHARNGVPLILRQARSQLLEDQA